ncbi:MAG: quinolinate synthase NadA [Fibromonadaceae bacterium]|nr:quinolinate synthase NadA [Fibromonadaceae bacterium]
MRAIDLYNKLRSVQHGTVLCQYSMEKCEKLAVLINEINELKRERDAAILAHSYVAPEITFGVADYSGDSYQLSKNAMETHANTIIFAAVEFMGETAKILNPNKRVFIPGSETGCSLAGSITGEQAVELRNKYRDYTFVCYINTTADVKAACDVCVTSSNVVKIVSSIPSDKIVFLPDRLMGENLKNELAQRDVKKELVLHTGTCYVHEQYDPDLVKYFRMQNEGLRIVSHPECRPEVAALSDFVGSTGQMLEYIRKSPEEAPILLLTECGLNARLQTELPHRQFIGSCSLCKYMKSNSLENILQTLKAPQNAKEIKLDADVLANAKRCIENMFVYSEN